MKYMFSNATTFNQPIGEWDVSNVRNMESMFSASVFNQLLNSWDVSNVLNMDRMFAFSNFNQDISSWDVSNVNDMTRMFRSAFAFNQNLSSWNDNINDFHEFSYNTPQWILAKPNFINCTS